MHLPRSCNEVISTGLLAYSLPPSDSNADFCQAQTCLRTHSVNGANRGSGVRYVTLLQRGIFHNYICIVTYAVTSLLMHSERSQRLSAVRGAIHAHIFVSLANLFIYFFDCLVILSARLFHRTNTLTC